MTITIPKTNYRTVQIPPSPQGGDGDDYLEFSFSSEVPVERFWGIEILDHSPDSVNFSRMNSAPFLWNHNTDVVLGRVESAKISSERKGRCTIRWSKEESAQKYKRQVKDGILTNVSVSYMILDTVVEKKDGKEQIKVTKWEPVEISLVSVPADATVGIGRNMAATIEEKPQINLESERARVAEILALTARYNCPDLNNKFINEGTTIESARGAILERVTSQNQTPAAVYPVDPLGLSPKEEKSYSIVRAINAAVSKDWSKAGFEKECSDEIAERSGKSTEGFFAPIRDLKVGKRAPYIAGTPAQGGYTVETDLLAENFIDLLRNKTKVVQAGAMMLSGLQGQVDIPRQAAASTAYWIAEQGTITPSEGTFDQVTLRPKDVAALSQMSRRILMQSSIDIEQFVREDFAQIISLAIDLAAISGSGTSNQPTGILNTAGVGSVALGANGGAITWQAIVDLYKLIQVNNADAMNMAFMTNPLVEAALLTTPKQASGVEGNFILQSEIRRLLGYMLHCTNQVPSNLTKGSGTNLSAMIFGNWRDLIIGEWGILEILPNPYGSGYNKGAVDIRVMKTVDMAVRHPKSFSVITDIVAA